jgi:HPt (histidine-containing phosphotransfer) domain-containing protein
MTGDQYVVEAPATESPAALTAASVAGGATSGLLDATAVAELREFGADEFAELIHMFLDDGATKVAALRTAQRVGNATDVATLAHSLKGIAGTFGAGTLVSACGELAVLTAASDPALSRQLIDAIADAFMLASDALRQELMPGAGITES